MTDATPPTPPTPPPPGTRGASAPGRLLVVLPSWVGDVCMATPTLRAIRQAFPGILIGGLCRPGIDDLLAGCGFFDDLHVQRASGVMGPKHAAARVRHARYDTALLLTNSFSTALAVRMAGIPRRIGYDRDARGILLTDKLKAPTRPDGSWSPVPAVDYYWTLAERFLLPLSRVGGAAMGPLQLGLTDAERDAGNALLERALAGRNAARSLAILNPGGNNPAKRWPADRFARLGAWLADAHAMDILVNGSPGERDLTGAIASDVRRLAPGAGVGDLAASGVTLSSLKAIVARAGLMVTNDTGPRHIAAAFGVPVVTLFGPTDHRWTTIPTRPDAPEAIVLADPTLPDDQLANDHPERCAIDRIHEPRVRESVSRVLGASGRAASRTPLDAARPAP
ncbi:MAG: glycosyltransferase family 9 protein [Planctomycetota bacterium]|nr:glycosyltransferase family 9 protein [Planctomycetota bacterium]